MAQKPEEEKEKGGGYGERWSLPVLYRTIADVWLIHELDDYGDEILRVLTTDEVLMWQLRLGGISKRVNKAAEQLAAA